ncbi:MAG: T9SS type A sorting domain-containing protein [Saprospiraceae bacterium]|nr:T9SS type A sorting domain-containing protein [Saprospiraceae bacterium]MBK7796602.1 T9SS type A sorting domain-containing protein [Saprospiraceae bacterium]MBK8152686.1 T9SS type A sorting domain-containing protein [Saprospiraceae bacterium]MBK9378788.1 T9SS type A sorting domain-containing protein [Saprospiraceae bacterium]
MSNIMGKDKVCEGFCGEKWNVYDQPGGCDPYYEWTWDGVPVGGNESEVTLDDEWGPGPYTLCVTAFIGNEDRSSICDEEGPKCKTITVLPKPEYKGPDKYICSEDVPYDWHGASIFADGEYEVEFTGPNCCKFDSIRRFYILPKPDEPDVYYIGCDPGDTYIDPTTHKRFSGCNNYAIVKLPNSTSPYRCDSSYKLFAINPGYDVVFEFDTTNKNRLYTAHVLDTGHYCGNEKRMVRQYSYKWFTKQDSNKILGTDTFLQTKSKADYCFQLSVYITFGTIEDSCTFSFCENLDEDQLTNSFQQNLASKTILFPNPAENTLHISVPDYILIQYLEILKNDGSKLLQLQLKNKSNYTADISGLNNGAYYLVLHTNKGDIIKSFVKSEFK